MNYPPPPPGGGPPPGGYGAPPPGAPGGYQDGYQGQGGYGPPPPGMVPYTGAPMMQMQAGAPYGIDPVSGLPFSEKSKMVAGLLQIFLGWTGAGRFYTGHMGIAIAQILVGWMTCGIWPLIDGIMMLTGKVKDAQGRPLRD